MAPRAKTSSGQAQTSFVFFNDLWCSQNLLWQPQKKLSLDDQKRELEAVENREGLKVVERFDGTKKGESHTAFKRGRPIFNHIMQEIEAGVKN